MVFEKWEKLLAGAAPALFLCGVTWQIILQPTLLNML
jgi:hypothetical protein